MTIQVQAARTPAGEKKTSLKSEHKAFEARTVFEAFQALDEGDYEAAFIEVTGIGDFIEVNQFIAMHQQSKAKSAQLIGARTVTVWNKGAVWALPGWVWRIGFIKAELPMQLEDTRKPNGPRLG